MSDFWSFVDSILSMLGLKGSVVDESIFSSSYVLDKEIGKGSFAVVYRAVSKKNDSPVAVKLITRENLNKVDEDYIRSEAEILLELNHPNIIKCLKFYEEPDKFYMVLEIVTGGELFDRIVKKSYYTEKEARDLVEILLSTINHCHERDIVHRDLKPENLLLVSESEDAIIKLADFGLAARAAANTLTGFCGSPGYIAPEILCDTPHGRCDLEYGCHTNLLRLIGKPVDMWAIGIITYVLLGGYLPFDDPDKARTNKLIKRGIFEFHEMYWGEVSEEAKSLIRGLLTVDVNQRITAQQAMNHPWINKDAAVLAERNLEKQFTQFKKFHARRKFKAAARALIAAAKWNKLLKPKKTEETETASEVIEVKG